MKPIQSNKHNEKKFPNKETIAAIHELENGFGHKITSSEEFELLFGKNNIKRLRQSLNQADNKEYVKVEL